MKEYKCCGDINYVGPWSSLDKTSGFGLRVGGRNQKIGGSNPSGPATKRNGVLHHKN